MKKTAIESHLRSDDAPDVQVLREDQMKINMFGRLNNRLAELKEEVKSKKVPMLYPTRELSAINRACDIRARVPY